MMPEVVKWYSWKWSCRLSGVGACDSAGDGEDGG